MVFNVYFDPEIISVAATSPLYGLQALCDVLRGFLANGLLFDFEDERGRKAIGQTVNALRNDFDRKRATALFSALVKRNRILCLMEPDYTGKIGDLDRALELAPKYSIQLVLRSKIPTTPIAPEVEKVARQPRFRSSDTTRPLPHHRFRLPLYHGRVKWKSFAVRS